MAGRVSMIIEAMNVYVVYDAETRDSHCRPQQGGRVGRESATPPSLSLSLPRTIFAHHHVKKPINIVL